ncbi:hypothetical protein C0J52_25325 [Blattella germanica]|nr:hypothetical protein C0J52_25325 [Blattella germanica]
MWVTAQQTTDICSEIAVAESQEGSTVGLYSAVGAAREGRMGLDDAFAGDSSGQAWIQQLCGSDGQHSHEEDNHLQKDKFILDILFSFPNPLCDISYLGYNY